MFLSIWILSSSQLYEVDTDMISVFKVERELSKLLIWTKLSDIWVYVLDHHHTGMFFYWLEEVYCLSVKKKTLERAEIDR